MMITYVANGSRPVITPLSPYYVYIKIVYDYLLF